MRRRSRSGAALLIVLVAAAVSAAMPLPATSSIADDEDVVAYRGDTLWVAEGYPDERDMSWIDLACREQVCRPLALPGWYDGMPDAPVTFPIPGTLAFTSTRPGTLCEGDTSAPVHVEFVFTETTVTGTAVADERSSLCDVETVVTGTMTLEGAIGYGACHFTAEGCDPADAEPVDLSYEVALDDSNQIGEGAASDVIGVRCEGIGCRLTSFPRLAGLVDAAPEFRVPGTLEFTSEAEGGSCDAAATGPFDVALTFTETTVTGTAEKGEWSIACDDGELMALAQTVGVEGALSSGACYFEVEGCAEASPTAAPSAAPADPAAEPAGVADDQDASGQDGSGADAAGTMSRLGSGDAAAPSVLSALRPPTAASVAPSQLLLAALITIILVLLMAFPTSLLNSAIETAGDRFTAWRERRGGKAAPPWRGSWWWAATGVLAAAIISAFVDPQFGANPGSLRVLLSIIVSFAVEIVLGWVVLLWIMRRLAPGATRSFSFRPLSLLIVVVAVVFTRITGFEPGIVFGLVAGLGFATTMGVAAKARTTLVPLAYALGLGLLSWLAYGLVAGTSGDSVAATLLVETLSSLTIGGMVALPLALVPIKGLSGHAVWQADPRLWALSYGIGLLAFFIVLMPMPFSWAEVGWELAAWIGVYVAYAAVAVAAWAIVKRPWHRERVAEARPSGEPVTAQRPPDPMAAAQAATAQAAAQITTGQTAAQTTAAQTTAAQTPAPSAAPQPEEIR